MPRDGDKLMQAQCAYKENKKKRAFADPKHCPKCGMSVQKATRSTFGQSHFAWCPDWTDSLAGKMK